MKSQDVIPCSGQRQLILVRLHRSTYHGGCLPSALELFCGLITARSQKGDALPELQQQAILFVNGVVRNAGYRGKTAAGMTLTPAAREQVYERSCFCWKVSADVLAAK